MSRSPGSPSGQQMPRSLYIRSIPFSTTTGDLRELFSHYGEVKDVYIPRDFYSRRPRGFAYVEFQRSRDADRVVNDRSGRLRLFGYELEVEFAQGDRKSPNEMRVRHSEYQDRRNGRRYEQGQYRSQRSRSRSVDRGSRDYRTRSHSRSPSRERTHRRASIRRSRTRSRSSEHSRKYRRHSYDRE